MNKKIEYKQYIVDSQLRYFKPHATKIEKSFAEEISYSLNQNSKSFLLHYRLRAVLVGLMHFFDLRL